MYKVKRDELGAIVKYKARLVARGFVQCEDIDFEEVFAPVARMESIRLLLALAAAKDWRVHHLDIKSAFLNGELTETVFVRQPLGSPSRERSTGCSDCARRSTGCGRSHEHGTLA